MGELPGEQGLDFVRPVTAAGLDCGCHSIERLKQVLDVMGDPGTSLMNRANVGLVRQLLLPTLCLVKIGEQADEKLTVQLQAGGDGARGK